MNYIIQLLFTCGNVIASASASASGDNSVKIWDVTTGECNITMENHINKVYINPYPFNTAHIYMSVIFWSWGCRVKVV